MDQSSVMAPTRSMDQRMEALARANDIRAKRAQFKKDIKAGRISLDELIELVNDPPDYIKTLSVFEMLRQLPKWGRVKATAALKAAGISHAKTVSGITDRQRRELVNLLSNLR